MKHKVKCINICSGSGENARVPLGEGGEWQLTLSDTALRIICSPLVEGLRIGLGLGFCMVYGTC